MDEKKQIEIMLTAEVLNLAYQITAEKANKNTTSSVVSNIPEAIRQIKHHRSEIIKKLSEV